MKDLKVKPLGGQGGFMIFSGSVLPDAPDNYQGSQYRNS